MVVKLWLRSASIAGIRNQRFITMRNGIAACETNWSLYEWIVNKRRNRLSVEKQKNLVYVNANLRFVSKLLFTFYFLISTRLQLNVTCFISKFLKFNNMIKHLI